LDYDAIVIGAGMSGLAAAIRIAMSGLSVCVLERHNVPGGLNSYYTQEGRAFDVGLHALTNFVPARTPGAPLTRVLRQLRIRHEELRLGEHEFSEIVFPGERLTFTNEFEHFEGEIERVFPHQRDAFAALVNRVRAFELREDGVEDQSARAVVGEILSDPLLIEMILCPILYYGSAREDDVAWSQFVVLFRSIFLEGLSRPEGGVRRIVNLLIKRLKAAGAELRYGSGVRRIRIENGRAQLLELDDGEVLRAGTIFSSAGRTESLRLAGREVPPEEIGRLTFLESVSMMKDVPASFGHGAATSFFCTEERIAYRIPQRLIDVRSGVISAPNNFRSKKPLKEGCMRLTVLANYEAWHKLSKEEYVQAKIECAEQAIAEVAAFCFDWRPHTVYRDVFTPCTIRRFTGHVGGAVYGSPKKSLTGESGIPGLVLCGTDQGYLGIVGAMFSGVAMANRHLIAPHQKKASSPRSA